MKKTLKNNKLAILFFFGLICFFTTNLMGQNFKIGHTEIKFVDENRNNRQIKTDIYFPVISENSNDGDFTENFPVVCFGHGFVMSAKSYKNVWKALVPKGYIFAIPKKERGIAPSHLDLALDLVFVLNEFRKLNSDSASFFFQKIHSKNVVMGHSMGGGSAVLAAQNKNAVHALVNLAAYETTPSAIAAATNVDIPSLIFSGENDCITPPGTHQIPMYNALKSCNKTYIEIIGGSHCQMARKNKLCSFGENTCKPKPEINYKKQHEIINRFLIPWLDFIVKSDSAAAGIFDNTLNSDLEITFKRSISLSDSKN
jgi:pimeloyl-ACP methyl ester carboxylesterase